MKKNQLFIISLVVLILLLAIFFIRPLLSKEGGEKKSNEETPVEQPNETSGFSFSQDENIRLAKDQDEIYVLGNAVRKVNFEEKTLTEAEYHEAIYQADGATFSLSDGKLILHEQGEQTVLAEGIQDSRAYENKLLYRDEKGISLFHYDKKISQQLMGNAEGKEALSLDKFELIDHAKYFAYFNDETGETEINLTETLEHVFNFDGKISSASWTSDAFLFEDLENLNRVGYYNISGEEISKFSLTTDNEKVIYSPKFDGHGMVRYLTEKEGMVNLNKLDVTTQMVKKIAMANRADFVKESKIDGYIVIQFKDRFYYSKDDIDYKFYTLPNDQIAFSNEQVYVTQGSELKAIKGDSFKSYSLKGKPIATLATDSAFYYTYLQDGRHWLDKVNID